ncbi:hypothetical protein C5E07_11485 [Pseudoclavibacter sp. RFBJ3]|uniref:hypothetical protein n=1 Tax=unclassified Pseudoclavibacter TaxID=2615177 RepID=UPI000CE9334E|nr:MULTISPECIES: hypothetical protein [unclassified Pseudoclavibacter]PPF83307.1 hypothetical protein C5C12_10560 [Pseudoclavibacter sp. RFBJ5]PPF91849.1 hypothetical protein C5E07_11485 [Pseudoclavibacter sp. RFBJ3]PPG01103.1 hypothetical protein C5C19_00470 [Pseudoclavibacter sp. RFBH5]PPG26206.1 hypothetical protein C5E13_00425 [Pseudoclavibacter sp. RFBI4]
MYDTLLPNLIVGLGLLALVVGTVLLATGRGQFGTTKRGATRLLSAFVLLQAGVFLWMVSMWVDGTGSLVGRVIATVGGGATLVFVIPGLRRIHRVLAARHASSAREES